MRFTNECIRVCGFGLMCFGLHVWAQPVTVDDAIESAKKKKSQSAIAKAEPLPVALLPPFHSPLSNPAQSQPKLWSIKGINGEYTAEIIQGATIHTVKLVTGARIQQWEVIAFDSDSVTLAERGPNNAKFSAASSQRKHHVKPAELALHHQDLASDLARLNSDEERLEGMEDELADARLAFVQAAEALSQSRQRYAQELGTKVTASMHELAMPDGRFAIEVRPDAQSSLSPLGIDRVEFMVTTNPGQPIQPLGKVASGGELSRISLAIVVISARKVSTPTLIFDEVDVGISGPTAAVVGRLLRQLGESTQVMVVTHLPQVAGKGHQHMVVSKHTDGKTTETQMQALDQGARLKELARLLGGDHITDNTLANARELLAS